MTDTAPPNDRLQETEADADAALVRVEYPSRRLDRPRRPTRSTASPSSRSTGRRRSTPSASTCSTSSSTALERLDARPGLSRDRADRRRRPGLRGRGRHPRARRPDIGLAGRRRAVRRLGPDRGDRPAADRRRPRVRARRRLRARDGLRHDRRRRRRDLRPARDHARGHARRGRHPATDPGDRQGAGDGADPDRPDDDRPGGARPRARHAGSSRPRRPLDAALELAAVDRDDAAARGPRRQGRDPRRGGACPERRSCAASATAFFALFDTDDQAEGMAAFIEKRPPVWSGR